MVNRCDTETASANMHRVKVRGQWALLQVTLHCQRASLIWNRVSETSHVKVSLHLHSFWCCCCCWCVVHRQRQLFHRQGKKVYIYRDFIVSIRLSLDFAQSQLELSKVQLHIVSAGEAAGELESDEVWSAVRYWSLQLADSREVCSRAKRDTVSVEQCTANAGHGSIAILSLVNEMLQSFSL